MPSPEDLIHEIGLHPWMEVLSYRADLPAGESLVTSLLLLTHQVDVFLGWTWFLRQVCPFLITLDHRQPTEDGHIFEMLVLRDAGRRDTPFLEAALRTLREVPC